MKCIKMLIMFLVFMSVIAIGGSVCYAANYTVQDDLFTLYGDAARVSDSTASDGYCASMNNSTADWNVQYINTDFSYLKPGTLYDVYARVKVKHAVANPSGDAFKMGVYDLTYGEWVLGAKYIPAADTEDMVWKEYKIGTFAPNSGVNKLTVYVGKVQNASQISEIYVDSFVFKKCSSYTIGSGNFVLTGSAAIVTDGMFSNDNVARMTNGPGGDFNIEVPIDGTKIEQGKQYRVCARVAIEPANWNNLTGQRFSYSVYDYTTNSYLVNPIIAGSTDAPTTPNYYLYDTEPIAINPSHQICVRFHQVDNASVFPAFKVSQVFLQKTPEDEKNGQSIKAYPYKISPANADGLNDSTKITYTLPSACSSLSVEVRRFSDNSLVKTLVSNTVQSGTNSVVWDGKDNNGQFLANGLYVIRVCNNGSDVFKVNVEVITGVSLINPINDGLDYIPKGVWFEGIFIPPGSTYAQTYLDERFSDIQNLGANTVFVIDAHSKDESVYSDMYDKAAAHNLKVISLPNWNRIIYNETLFNDEIAMYDTVSEIIGPYTAKSALAGYLIYDEPACDPVVAERLKDMKRIFETIDPQHPSFVCFNELSTIPYHYTGLKTRCIEVDPYCVRYGKAIGEFEVQAGVNLEKYLDYTTLQVRKDIVDRAPLWTVMQIFSHLDWARDPTPEEVRAITYEAIGHGSKGFAYFMYHTEYDWIGLVDQYYNHTTDYTTVQNLFSEITVLNPTIQNMRRIANVAATTGGGNSAYASADVTTHEDIINENKYLVVVNHDCENSANVTITIDRAKLGMCVSEIRNAYDNTIIPFTTSATSYTINNLNFAAGTGKILKLVKNSFAVTYTGQDSSFIIYNGGTIGNADISTLDARTARYVVANGSTGWYIQWPWDKTNLTAGAAYDLYAVVKVKYADSLDLSGTPSGYAFAYGAYDATAHSAIVPTTYVQASDTENMFWHTVKIGTFVPSQTNTQYAYIMPGNDPNNVHAVYVDKFYFERQP